MFEALKPISTFAAKNVPAVFLFVVLLFLIPDCNLFWKVIQMRDEFAAYFQLVGILSFCVLVVRSARAAWACYLQKKRLKQQEECERLAVEKEAARKAEKERQEAEMKRLKVKAQLDRQACLFTRLSIQEQRMLIHWYVGKEKNHYGSRMDDSIVKLENRGYIDPVGLDTFCLSDWVCDLLDARLEELRSRLAGLEREP